jgi:hypothetical protein
MTKKSRFQFSEHPWISLLIIILLLIVLVILSNIIRLGEIIGLGDLLNSYILLIFVIVPFVLDLPKGKRSYKEFLSDIRLSSTPTPPPPARNLLLAHSSILSSDGIDHLRAFTRATPHCYFPSIYI